MEPILEPNNWLKVLYGVINFLFKMMTIIITIGTLYQ